MNSANRRSPQQNSPNSCVSVSIRVLRCSGLHARGGVGSDVLVVKSSINSTRGSRAVSRFALISSCFQSVR